MVAHACNASSWEAGAEGPEFEDSLVYMASIRPAWAT